MDIKDMTSFKWATVRGTNPLSVQLDGDPAPLALIPDSLVDPAQLKVLDRVRVELSLRKVVIHGKSSGFPKPPPTEGLSADRPANPHYWQFYYETDTQKMMVGSRSGTWRQYAGTNSDIARAWATTQGASGGALVAGRTIEFSLPTVLEGSEDVIVWPRSVSSGFGIVTLNGTTRNPTDTTISVRFMQLASFTIQPLVIGWQVSPAAV